MNQIKAGVILSYISLSLTTFLGVVYTPFMLRQMGQSEYGLYALAASVIAYLTLFDFGFGNAVIRFTAKFRAEGKKREQYEMFGMFFLLYCGIALLTVIVGILVYNSSDIIFGEKMTPEELARAKIIILLLLGNTAITFPFSIFSSIITAYEDFIFLRAFAIFRLLLQTAIMIPLLLWGYKALALSILITVFNIITLFVNTGYCFKKLKIKIYFTNINWSFLKEISGYSFYIFLNMIMDRIYWSSGQFILGHTSGLAGVAVYSVSISLVNFYMLASTAIPGVLLPKLTALVAQKASDKEISDLFIRTGRMQFLIVGLVLAGFIIFGRKFITLWAGEGYVDSYISAVILMVALFPALIQNTGIAILQARNQLKFRAILYVVVAVACLIFGYILALSYGGVGCALGTACSLFIGTGIVINLYYWKKINLNIYDFWRQIFRMSIPLLILGCMAYFIELHFSDLNLIVYIIEIIVFAILVITAFWFFSMNLFEKDLIRAPILKILNKIR